jgi:hypothetical protein
MAAVLKTHDRYWGNIAIYGDYKAWTVHAANGGDRSNYPAHSRLILDLKDANVEAVEHFRKLVEPELRDNVVIVTVPSHGDIDRFLPAAQRLDEIASFEDDRPGERLKCCPSEIQGCVGKVNAVIVGYACSLEGIDGHARVAAGDI